MARRRHRFVPSLVFSTAVTGVVVPACGGDSKSEVGQSGGEGGAGGGVHVIVLAIGGFTGSGGRPGMGGVIVLAIAGFWGGGFGGTAPATGGRATGGSTDAGPADAMPDAPGEVDAGDAADGAPRDATDDSLIVLAISGFRAPRPSR